jgi:hypothetical protein
MAVPSRNVLLALFIISFSLSAIFHRASQHNDSSPPIVFSQAADIFVPSTNDTFFSRPAAFGSDFPEQLPGRLVKAWGDGLACSDVASEAADDDLGMEYEGMIVLVQRGLCSFVEKVRRVQHAGGIAVIVGDNVAGSGMVTMYAKGEFLRTHCAGKLNMLLRRYKRHHHSIDVCFSRKLFVLIIPPFPSASFRHYHIALDSIGLAFPRYSPSRRPLATIYVGVHLLHRHHPTKSPAKKRTCTPLRC